MNKQVIQETINELHRMKKRLTGAQGCSVKHEEENSYSAKCLRLAISALTHQLTNGWIPVTKGLPENEERVFILANKRSYNGDIIQIRTTAMYEDGTLHTEDSSYVWEDNDFEYCEETDDYIIPEGWFEQNMYCEEYGIIDDFVTHWMPLPELPRESD